MGRGSGEAAGASDGGASSGGFSVGGGSEGYGGSGISNAIKNALMQNQFVQNILKPTKTGNVVGQTPMGGGNGGAGELMSILTNASNGTPTTVPIGTPDLSGGFSSNDPNEIAAEIAKRLFLQTQGTRDNVFNELNDFTDGNFDIATSPMWKPGKMALEDQYSTARDNVMSNIPTGGSLNESLTDLDIGKAKSLTELIGQIEQDMSNKAYGVATNTPATAMNSLLSAGETQAANARNQSNIDANEDARKDSMMYDVGSSAAEMFLK